MGTGPLLLAALAACASACGAPGFRLEGETSPAVLFVSRARGSAGGLADGSAARPFASLADALRAAPSGALVRLDEGTWEGGLLLTRPVVLMGRGPARTHLVAAEASPSLPVLTARDISAVELRGLSVEGGAVGVVFEGGQGHVLRDVSLRGQSLAALRGTSGASISISDSEVIDVSAGLAGSGLVLTSGALQLRGCVLRRAGRRAIELHGTRAVVEDVDVAGSAVSALQATDGADVEVRGGLFAGNGGAAIYAGGARLRLHGIRAQGNEYGVLAFRGASVAVEGGFLSGHRIAAIAFVGASGSVRGTTIRHGGLDGGISAQSTPEPIYVEDTRLLEPGTFGIHLSNADAVVRRVEIASASLDGQGDLGDGIYASESTLLLEELSVHGNAGSGLSLTRSRGAVRGSDFVGNGRSGLTLLDRSHLSAVASFFGGNVRGVQVAERSELSLSGSSFDGNSLFAIDSGCGEGTIVREPGGGNRFTGKGGARACP